MEAGSKYRQIHPHQDYIQCTEHHLHSPQLSKMTFTDLYTFQKEKTYHHMSQERLVPNPLWTSGMDEGFTFDEVAKYDANVYNKMTLNNLFVYTETVPSD
jgi:hypothetical protein